MWLRRNPCSCPGRGRSWISGVSWLRMRSTVSRWLKGSWSSGWAASISCWGLQLHHCFLLSLGVSSSAAYCWHSQNHLVTIWIPHPVLRLPHSETAPTSVAELACCGSLVLSSPTIRSSMLLSLGDPSRFHIHWWPSSLFPSSYASGSATCSNLKRV